MDQSMWAIDPATGIAVLSRKTVDGVVHLDQVFDLEEDRRVDFERLWGNQIVVVPEPEPDRPTLSDMAHLINEAIKEKEAPRMATERENENVAWLRLMDALEDIREAIREDEHIRGPMNSYPNNDVLAMQQRLEETEFWAHKANARRGATVEEMEKARDMIEMEDAGLPEKPSGPVPVADRQRVQVHSTPRQSGKTAAHRAAQRAAAAVAANATMYVEPITTNGTAYLGVEHARERRMTK